MQYRKQPNYYERVKCRSTTCDACLLQLIIYINMIVHVSDTAGTYGLGEEGGGKLPTLEPMRHKRQSFLAAVNIKDLWQTAKTFFISKSNLTLKYYSTRFSDLISPDHLALAIHCRPYLSRSWYSYPCIY